ncbi:DUF998 domain-containing protein [Microbacterium suwonense]|uniref:DUF998 domain-containing protein n=1 Tax=Microbacterium suwonense TaxID=683047 RepID=A0ABM8FVP0_9MICO|nr:DUF998 domain-containing protein [Microbacterium suwonense]BDZ39725.1 hypothetical protein GCM10025863_23390 [Microbacterium suwonense]
MDSQVRAEWFDEGMDVERMLREQRRMLWATAACFVLGLLAGTAVLWGGSRPFSGDGSVIIPVALVAGLIAAAAFVVSTRMHRPGETSAMPRWQAVVSDVSAVAVTAALAGVTGLGVLLAGEVLAAGLQGLELPAIGGGVFTAVASALGGRMAFGAGIRLSTRDLASLLFAFLIIGTLFAMLTATDSVWWERSFSELGIGSGGWAFNGTLVIAGLLIATTGSYLGRDLHRMLGDAALRGIAAVVITWACAGLALAAVGLLPIDRVPGPHAIAAFATLALLLAAVIIVTVLMGELRMLRTLTIVLVLLIVIAVVLAFGLHVLSVAALEAVVVGLVLLWLTTLVQLLGILVPDVSRPSARRSPLR